MEVKAKTYLHFYDALFKAFSKLKYPNQDMQPLVKDVWHSADIVDGKQMYYTDHLFGAPPMYFYNQRTMAIKGNPVSVKDSRFGKAIEFLENVPENLKYKGPQSGWKDKAKQLKNQYENKYNLIEEVPKAPVIEAVIEENREKIFLDIVTSDPDTFNSKLITKIIADYFEAINSQNFYAAWALLSEPFKKHSIWDGDIKRFENSFAGVKNVHFNRSSDFTYRQKSVQFNVSYSEEWIQVDVKRFKDTALTTEHDNAGYCCSKAIQELEDFMRRYWSSQEGKSDRLNLRRPSSTIIEKMKVAEVEDYNFQKLFSIYFHNEDVKSYVDDVLDAVIYEKRKSDSFIADVVCSFIRGKWLIERISNNSTYHHFYPHTKDY